MNRYFACVCLFAALIAQSAGLASTISYPTTTPVPASLTDWTSTLEFPKFDPALGTLVSVQLKIDAACDTVLSITNNSAKTSKGWAVSEVMITVQDAGNNLVDPAVDLMTPMYNFTLAAGGSVTSGTLHAAGTSDDLYVAPAVLAAFTGTGTIPLTASTQTFTILAYNGGNTSATQTTSASAGGTVIYEYQVPEPITLSLLALGLPFLRRRRD